MKQAYLAMRVQQLHKRDAMLEGLKVLGYRLETHPDRLKSESEVLFVTWNLHGDMAQTEAIRKRGGTVIVIENPYIPYDIDGREYMAMAVEGHNGSGITPSGSEDRLTRLGIRLKPWREGEHILVVGQRGIGSPIMRSPPQWGELITERLKHMTNREVIHRPHPGRVNVNKLPPLEDQLEGAYCIVMWASNVATTALIMGIPVFYNAPHCVLERACNSILSIEQPQKAKRWPAFQDLSWAQWNLDEISSGEAFKRLIECKLLSRQAEIQK